MPLLLEGLSIRALSLAYPAVVNSVELVCIHIEELCLEVILIVLSVDEVRSNNNMKKGDGRRREANDRRRTATERQTGLWPLTRKSIFALDVLLGVFIK